MKTMNTMLAAVLAVCLLVPMLAAGEMTASTEEAAALSDRVRAVIADADDMIELYEEDLSELMGIEQEDYEDFVYLAPMNPLSGREVIVLLAVDDEAAERIEGLLRKYLEGRRTEMKNYEPEAFKLLSETDVVRADRLVLLVVGENAAEEIKLLTTEE